jgi:hypothetical protein
MCVYFERVDNITGKVLLATEYDVAPSQSQAILDQFNAIDKQAKHLFHWEIRDSVLRPKSVHVATSFRPVADPPRLSSVLPKVSTVAYVHFRLF